MQKIHEALLQTLEVAVVRLQVIVVDVGDDRDHRLQMHERGITLIRFGHEIATLSQTCIRIRSDQAPADDECRIEPAFCKHACHHAGRRRLAVRSRNRNRIAKAHELAEHFRTLHDRQTLRSSLDDFRIRAADRTGDHDHIGVADVLRGVSDHDAGTELLEARSRGIRLEIAALHGIAEIEQHFRDAAHTDTADADEMNALDAAHAIAHASPPANVMHASASFTSASIKAIERAFVAIVDK